MAAIFQLSQASLWVRTGVMPRWMALITIVVALVLLFVFTQAWWVVLVFPAWVLLVSAYILIAQPSQGQKEAGERPA
jgi:L-asparagine transporter-like permease